MRTLSRYLLRRHLAPFSLALVVLTSLMLTNQIAKQLPRLRSMGVPSNVIVEIIVLSVPFIVAMTLPLAMLVAVLHVFTRLASDSEFTAVKGSGVSVLRLITLVLGGAACIAALSFLWNDQVLPRSNHRLRTLLVDIQRNQSSIATDDSYVADREMTIAELRGAARSAREEGERAVVAGDQVSERAARQRAARYEVEIQKKYAITAACVAFALLGVPVGLRFPRGRMGLVIGVTFAVFAVYYVGLIGGEELGDRMIVSPFFAMWTPNLIFGIVGLVTLWRLPRAYGESAEARVNATIPYEVASGPTSQQETASYLSRLWRGHIPLPMTYWTWGVLLNLYLVRILIYIAPNTPRLHFVFSAMYFAYYAFILVAIWRSSERYKGRPMWGMLARVSVMLGIIGTLVTFFTKD